MTKPEVQQQIQEIIDKYPKTYVRVLQNTQKHLLEHMFEYLPDIFKDDRFINKTRIYYFMHNISEPTTCATCGKTVFNLHAKTCSVKCAQRDPEIREKIKQTNLLKYGQANGHSETVKQQMRKNSFKKYGAAHHTQTESFKIKFKKQNLEKYNVEFTFQRPDVIKKIKETCLDRYGVENPFVADEFKEKIKKTHLNRYGAEHPMQVAAFRDKAKHTCLEKYGVEYPAQADEIKEKSKQTCLEKYGVEYTGQAQIKKEKTAKTCIDKYGTTTFAASEIATERTLSDFYNRIINTNSEVEAKFTKTELNLQHLSDNTLSWQCKRCGEDFDAPVNYNWWRYHGHSAYARCPTCFPYLSDNKISIAEKELFDFVHALCADAKQSDRTIIAPQELDIFIPSKNLAIEFDGLYWHSDDIKTDKNYHLNKTKACEEKGIHLIHVFEHEWTIKQHIVKSRFKNLFSLNENRIGARECKIKEIPAAAANSFLDENHLQGACNAKIRLGLFFNDALISVMTFSKTRFSKQYDWELVRFCNKCGYNISGAAGKLLKHFEKTYKPKSIVSYADRRWSYSKHNVYQTLGFDFCYASAPNYWYWKNSEFSSRVKYQKHKLANMLEKFDSNSTEVENMYANGFKRIFDCGNLVFVKTNN